MCHAEIGAARRLATTEVEIVLTEELARAFGEGPDLTRLSALWSGELTPFERAVVEGGLSFWASHHGLALGDSTGDEPSIRAADAPALELEAPFTVPLRVEPTTRRTFLSVEVAGAPRWLILDTGANVSVLSDAVVPPTAKVLGEGAFTNVGAPGTATYAEVDLKLGELALDDTAVLVLPAAAFRVGDLDFDGVLGWPVLSQLRVTLDFAAETATLGPPGPRSEEPNLRWWSGRPLVSGHLQGRPALLFLDLGGGFTQVYTSARERGIALAEGPSVATVLQGLTGREVVLREQIPGPVRVGLAGYEATYVEPVSGIADLDDVWCFDVWAQMDLFLGSGLTFDATAGELVFPAGH